MGKIDLSIPNLGQNLIDLRGKIPGNAYTWSWERPLDQINFLAIHHSGGPDSQTPQEIAEFHIQNNGWGGIGYHFLIDKNGLVYYVGDISTARTNVANLNEQVLGICLIGNFTKGSVPTSKQLESAHNLCQFLIDLSDLTNVKSWDKVRGHKELPGQATTCPGDSFESWRIQIVEGINQNQSEQTMVFNSPQVDLQSQVDSLQASLAAVNQRVISLQQALQQREQEIAKLKAGSNQTIPSGFVPSTSPIKQGVKSDTTLTLIQALINLYLSFEKLILPGKSGK